MTVRPGKQLIYIFAALTIWSLLCFVWPQLAWAVPVALLGVCIATFREFVSLSRGFCQIYVRRELPSPVARGREFNVTLYVENRGSERWLAEVRDELPAVAEPRISITTAILSPNRTETLSTQLRIAVRGKYTFGPAWIRLHGRWNLLEGQKAVGTSQAVQVYPESLLSQEELAKDAADELKLLDQLRSSRNRGVGTEFESLEEFRAGDDPRRIDWRTTARYRRPIVRRFQIERHRDLIVLLDCGRLMGSDANKGSKLDCAVDASLRLLRLALRGGDRCGLGVFDDQVLGYLRPIGGQGSLPAFLANLYAVQSRWHESDFGAMFATLQSRQHKRALVVVLSDVVDAQTSARYRASLLKLTQRHVVLFAALQTPLLREVIESPLRNANDCFKKSIVFRLMRDRQQAIHELRRGGVHVLDVEPSQLTAPLVNQFIQLRGANVL